MKIKGVIKNLKKNGNSKIYLGVSLEVLRAVWGQFSFRQFLVPAYISSQGPQAPSNVVNDDYKILICCTCHFQSSSLIFVCFGFLSLQVSSVSNFHPDTRWGKWSLIQAHLFNCAAGREEHCKQISLACVGSASSVWATLDLLPLTACVLSRLLRLQVALQGNCLRQALGCVHFPGLCRSGSGSQVLHKGVDSVGPGFCALPRSKQLRPADAGECTLLRCSASYHLSGPGHSVSQVRNGSVVSAVSCVSSGELISGCDPPGGCQQSRILGRLGQQLGACSQFGRGCCLWGRVCPLPSGSGCHSPASGGRGIGVSVASQLSSGIRSVLCSVGRQAVPQFRAFHGKVLSLVHLFFFFPSLWLAHSFGQSILGKELSHVSSLRLPSGHSGPVLTLSNAACTSLFSPHLLVADLSIWATSPLGVAVRHVICGFYFFIFFLPVMLLSEIPKLPTDPPVRGFPGVQELLLFYNSLPRMGLHP